MIETKMGSKTLENIQKIKYLGVMINSKYDNSDHVEQRIKTRLRHSADQYSSMEPNTLKKN